MNIRDYLEDLSALDWYGHNPIEWAIGIGIGLGIAIVSKVVRSAVTSRAKRIADRTSTHLDDAWVNVLASTGWSLYLALGLAGAHLYLKLPAPYDGYIEKVIFILFGIQTTVWVQAAITGFVGVWAEREGTSHANTAAGAVRFLSRLTLWTLLLLVVLGNLGVELTTLVAGLGVGGVAAALAVQKVAGDLISGLSMYFDRPFDIGDFVIVGDVLGNVTKIGLRTTRIDSVGGEKIIYPNGELVSKCIRNFQRMEERRIVFHFGIEYGLSAEKVGLARDIVEETIKSQPNVRFDRAHFQKFGAYSLEYEVVYFVLSREYVDYMNAQQAINLELYRRFEREGIPFAFPTQTLHHLGLEPLSRQPSPGRPA